MERRRKGEKEKERIGGVPTTEHPYQVIHGTPYPIWYVVSPTCNTYPTCSQAGRESAMYEEIPIP